MAVLSQHVRHHDGWEVHGLVGVGRQESVGREAVAQRMVAGFVVPQMQEGWFREVGRCYRGDLIVFVVLVLAAVGLQDQRACCQRSGSYHCRTYSSSNSNGDSDGNRLAKERRDEPSVRQTANMAPRAGQPPAPSPDGASSH